MTALQTIGSPSPSNLEQKSEIYHYKRGNFRFLLETYHCGYVQPLVLAGIGIPASTGNLPQVFRAGPSCSSAVDTVENIFRARMLEESHHEYKITRNIYYFNRIDPLGMQRA